jgi:hypothetical protein
MFIEVRPGNNVCQRKPLLELIFLNSILAHSVGKNTFTTASSVTSFLLEPQFCSSNVINTNIRSNLIRRTSAAKVSDFKMYRVCEKKLPDYQLWTPVTIEVYFFVMGVFNYYSFDGK